MTDISVSGSGNTDINTTPGEKLNLSTAQFISVNVSVDGTLRLNAQVDGFFGEQVNFSGGKLRFVGTSTFKGSDTVFNDNLVGSGTINVFHGSNSAGGSELMEINGSVGTGLTFAFEDGGPPASLQIDQPASFHGTIDLPPTSFVGFVAFMGLTVTRADLHNDTLRLFNGQTRVDTVRINPGNGGFQLEQNSQGVMLSQGGFDLLQPGGPGTAIPLHIA